VFAKVSSGRKGACAADHLLVVGVLLLEKG
jgi:hypothetical protein